jgi:hypothetical protein
MERSSQNSIAGRRRASRRARTTQVEITSEERFRVFGERNRTYDLRITKAPSLGRLIYNSSACKSDAFANAAWPYLTRVQT